MGIACTCVRSSSYRRASPSHILGISLLILLAFALTVAERGYDDSQPIEYVLVFGIRLGDYDYGYRR